MYEKRQLSNEIGEEFAKGIGAIFASISAEKGSDIQSLFNQIGQKIIEYEESRLIRENEKLNNELYNLKEENKKLKIRIEQLKEANDANNEIINKLLKEITNFNNNQNNNPDKDQMISKLNKELLMKEDIINNLKNQIKNSNITENKKLFGYEDILFVHFISMDQKVNCPIKCLSTDTFAEVEEKLYQRYSEYRETNNNFIAKGKVVLRFKKIYENNIKDGDKIQLLPPMD